MSGIVQDLTQGDVRRQLIRFSLPLVFTSLLQAMYSMVDMIVLGRFVGETGMSAITNSGQILVLVTNFTIGIAMGGNILIGQYFGNGDAAGRREATGTLFTLSIILGILSSVLLYCLARPILTLLGTPAMKDAMDYLLTCVFGLIFVYGYNALSAVLRGVGNSRTPMWIIIAATVLNTVLDILFVGPMKMGTRGAALATVIAQALSFLLAFAYLVRKRELFEPTLSFLRPRARQAAMIIRIGIPSSLQTTIGSISWLVVTGLINSHGVDASAANGAAIKIKDFCQLFTSAMAGSAASMIAQTLGAKKFDRAKQVMDEAMKITLLISAVMIVIVEAFTPQLVSVFTQKPEVARYAVLNLRIEIIAQLFYASFPVYNALAIGAGHTAFAMANSFVNCIVFRVVLALLLNRLFGITGLYIACMLAPGISVIIGHYYAKSGVWRRSLV